IDPCTGEDAISEEELNDAISAACSGDGRHAANTFVSEINEALDEFLGLGSILDPLQGDPLSSANRLCPDGIIIKPSSWSPQYQNVAGFTGLQVSLNNGSVNLTYENLFFDVDQTGDCNITTQQLIADAINSAIAIAEANLNSN